MEYDLLTRANAVAVVGYVVDEMLSSGVDNSEIRDYIPNETGYIIATLDPNTTGIYGVP